MKMVRSPNLSMRKTLRSTRPEELFTDLAQLQPYDTVLLGNVPREALTCGMASMLQARQILLVVSGPHKREILSRTLDEPPSPDVPASWLQEAPGDVVVLADRDARPTAPTP